MKIVKFKGGLGNQLFQYAFARHISDMFGEEVLFDSQTDKDNLEITRLSAKCKFADEQAVKRAVMLKGFRVASRNKRKNFAAANTSKSTGCLSIRTRLLRRLCLKPPRCLLIFCCS